MPDEGMTSFQMSETSVHCCEISGCLITNIQRNYIQRLNINRKVKKYHKYEGTSMTRLKIFLKNIKHVLFLCQEEFRVNSKHLFFRFCCYCATDIFCQIE